jgi:hypothetical protein
MVTVNLIDKTVGFSSLTGNMLDEEFTSVIVVPEEKSMGSVSPTTKKVSFTRKKDITDKYTMIGNVGKDVYILATALAYSYNATELGYGYNNTEYSAGDTEYHDSKIAMMTSDKCMTALCLQFGINVFKPNPPDSGGPLYFESFGSDNKAPTVSYPSKQMNWWDRWELKDPLVAAAAAADAPAAAAARQPPPRDVYDAQARQPPPRDVYDAQARQPPPRDVYDYSDIDAVVASVDAAAVATGDDLHYNTLRSELVQRWRNEDLSTEQFENELYLLNVRFNRER